MPSKVELSFATQADVEEFYGAPSFYSCRAVIARIDGEPVGLAGVYRVDKNMVVFTDIREGMRSRKKDILRASKMVESIMDRYPYVLAYADTEEETADSFGAHFNFMKNGLTLDGRPVMVRIRQWNK